tara:strand:+ start:1746 stop:2240 length:495 start_codon:yes stop_codon:yes gene_type:complete
MASRVEYAVNITPVRTIAASGDYDAHDVMANDVGKSLGGSASVATAAADHTTVGYASKTVAYGNALATGGAKLQLGADATDYKMVFIKNTGKEWGGNATTLGDANSQGLEVYIETTADMATSAKFTIPAEGAVCLPNIDLGTNMGIWVISAGDASLAVEYALIS